MRQCKVCLFLFALLSYSSGLFAQDVSSGWQERILPVLIAAQHEKDNREYHKFLIGTLEYANKNKSANVAALQEFCESLESKKPFESIEAFYKGLQVFSQVLAKRYQLDETSCYEQLAQEVRHDMQQLKDQEKLIGQSAAGSHSTPVQQQTFEQCMNQAVVKAVNKIVSTKKSAEIDNDKLPLGGTRAGTSKLTIGDGSGNNVLVVTDQGDLTLQRNAAGLTLVRVNSSDDSITLGATASTGEIKVGIATTVNGTVSIANATTTGTNTVNIGGAASTTGTDTINIGTGVPSGAGNKTISIATGANTSGGTTTVNIGTGSMTGGSGNSAITIGSATMPATALRGVATTVDGSTSLIINGGAAGATTTIGAAGTTGEIKVGIAEAANGTVSITNATTTGTNTVNIGGAASATGTDLINIGTGAPTDAGNKTISIATGDNAHGGTTTVSIGTGSMTSGSGNSAITIGSATMPATALRGVATTVDGSTSLIINGGAAGATTTIGATGTTGEIKVGIATTGETSTVSIGNGIPATGVTHTVNIGSASISSTGQDIINIGTGTIDTVAGAKTVNIATGNATTGTKAVNVATGSGVVTVAVGSSSSKIGIGTSAPGSAGVAISGPATTIDGTTSLIINGGTADATTTIGAAGTTGEIKVGIATTVNGTVSITNATTTGTNTVNIGGAASTTGTDLINIGTGAPTDVGNKTISIATGDNAHGGTTTVSIGTGSMTSGSGNSAITIGSATMPTVNIVTSSSGASTYKQADGTYAAPSYTFSNSTGGISTGNYYYSDTTRIANTAFAINESETFDVNQGPALTFMANGTFAVAYTTATTPGTYLRRYNANYSAIAAAAQVDTDNVAGATSGAAIAYDASHDYIIVAWVKADGGVYVRPYTSAGVAVNAAVLVSSGHAAATTGEFPSLAIEGDGTIGVFWRATADGILYGNTVSTSWAAGTAVAVSGTGTVAAGGGQCAAYLGGTKAVVCWKRSNADGDQNKLYYNTYDITTGTAGTPALVQDTALDASDKHGAVAALRFGNVMFAYKTGANSLHRQVRDNTLATTITADAELVAATGNQCALAADGLSFMVAYATGGIVGKELMVANYDSVGTAIGTGIRVTSASEDTINIASRPAMALCGGDCVASWYQYHATVPEAVKAQAFSLKGMGASTIGGRSMRTSTIGGTNALKNTTDVYGTLNVTGGDIATSGNLYVNGSVNMAALTMSGSLNVNGDICATGAINGNRTSCPSDKRIKTNIETLDQHACLKTINQLRPVSYTFTPEFIRKANAQASKQVGLIAQEVEPFAPEIVLHGTFAGEDLKTISYERLVPYLISSIQELNKKIEQLEAKK